MKTAVIFVLLLALIGAAFLTRPSEASFKQYIVDQKTSGDNDAIKRMIDEGRAQQFLAQCTFADRMLWVDVQQNGKTIYSGAFSHWFNRSEIARSANDLQHSVDPVSLHQKK